MLSGVRANERIIIGAYVDRAGGVCPMLAAHRQGGRTDFLSFARSWDRFTRAEGKSRPATERELRILTAQLEDSLLGTNGTELDEAIREHRQLRLARLRRRRRLLAEGDPTGEIRAARLRRRRAPRRGEDPASQPAGTRPLLPTPA